MRAASAFVVAPVAAALLWGCVTRTIDAPVGLTSFAVELVAIDPVSSNDLPPGCDASNDLGSAECPRPFAAANAPVQVRVRAVALDSSGAPMVWSGAALLRAMSTAGFSPPRIYAPIPDEERARAIKALDVDLEAAWATRPSPGEVAQ